MKHINKDNLFDYAFVNEDTLTGAVRAVCVCFHGYTDATMLTQSNELAAALGRAGIAFLFPYYSVWGWMGSNAQLFIEQCIDAAYDRLGLDDGVPLLVTGGSMGGLTALNYAVIGKRRICGCAAVCAVADITSCYNNIPDMRRAILSAHIEKEGDLLEITDRFSPVNFADRLPKVPYFLLYGAKDSFFTGVQLPEFIKALDSAGVEYELLVHPDMGHCNVNCSPEIIPKWADFLINCIK